MAYDEPENWQVTLPKNLTLKREAIPDLFNGGYLIICTDNPLSPDWFEVRLRKNADPQTVWLQGAVSAVTVSEVSQGYLKLTLTLTRKNVATIVFEERR